MLEQLLWKAGGGCNNLYEPPMSLGAPPWIVSKPMVRVGYDGIQYTYVIVFAVRSGNSHVWSLSLSTYQPASASGPLPLSAPIPAWESRTCLSIPALSDYSCIFLLIMAEERMSRKVPKVSRKGRYELYSAEMNRITF